MRTAPTLALAAIFAAATVPATAADAGAPDADLRAVAVDDSALRDTVLGRLYADRLVDLDDLEVSVSDGVVTLSGTVASLRAERRAVETVGAIPEVLAVRNALTVSANGGPPPAALETRVREALAAAPELAPWGIDVAATADGRVTLAGTVDTWDERRALARVAGAVPGVTAVDNTVTVAYATQPADPALLDAIRQRLQRQPAIDRNLVDVTVLDGVVTLSGAVGSVREREAAVEAAWVEGVRSVQADDLTIADWAADAPLTEPGVAATEDAMLAAVRRALEEDPRVAAEAVTVDIDGDDITLSGRLPDAAAREAAVQTAEAVQGVDAVVDRLTVGGAP